MPIRSQTDLVDWVGILLVDVLGGALLEVCLDDTGLGSNLLRLLARTMPRTEETRAIINKKIDDFERAHVANCATSVAERLSHDSD